MGGSTGRLGEGVFWSSRGRKVGALVFVNGELLIFFGFLVDFWLVVVRILLWVEMAGFCIGYVCWWVVVNGWFFVVNSD